MNRIVAGLSALAVAVAVLLIPAGNPAVAKGDPVATAPAPSKAHPPPPVRCYFNWLGLVCIRLR